MLPVACRAPREQLDSTPWCTVKNWLARLWCSSTRPKAVRPRRVVLWLEQLENRLAPAVITVTTTADDIASGDGSVSLREAITAVNAGNDLGDPDITAQTSGQTFGPIDFINFNIQIGRAHV